MVEEYSQSSSYGMLKAAQKKSVSHRRCVPRSEARQSRRKRHPPTVNKMSMLVRRARVAATETRPQWRCRKLSSQFALPHLPRLPCRPAQRTQRLGTKRQVVLNRCNVAAVPPAGALQYVRGKKNKRRRVAGGVKLCGSAAGRER